MGVQNRVTVLSETCQMADLLREHHIYVGKAGAATMFECYASRVPVLVNFTLPGQEQGNLQLLVSDGAGCHVESTTHLVDTIDRLLEGDAAGWQRLCQAMSAASRERGAERVAKAIFNKFGV